MELSSLKKLLTRVFGEDLPGTHAQYLLAPRGREQPDIREIEKKDVRKAAVLALFFKSAGLNPVRLVLTLRAEYEGVHSAQISFPGGQREDQDQSYLETALRETREEIGISPDRVDVVGELTPLYIPPSNFLVYPFVGVHRGTPDFTPDPVEVQRILTPPFKLFLTDHVIRHSQMKIRGSSMQIPAFEFDDHRVWGATAMILSELRQMLLPYHQLF